MQRLFAVLYLFEMVKIEVANPAGTTSAHLRSDADLAAARVNVFLRELVKKSGGVSTVGCVELEPNAINVIPSKVIFTADLRNPDKEKREADERSML